MPVSVRVKDAVAAFAVIAAALCAAVALSPPVTPALSAVATDPPVLVIDAGHGGEDGGAISISGKTESNINLDIARKLDLILGLLGEDTVLLRSEDVSLHSDGARTLREKKVSDLANRVDAINGQAGAVLISIHQNSYPDPRYGGAQVFYAPTDGSQELARTLQATLRERLDPDNTRQEKRIPDTIYLMNRVNCAAALVECGFLTNARDEARLLDGGYQTKLAATLAVGYLDYLHSFK